MNIGDLRDESENLISDLCPGFDGEVTATRAESVFRRGDKIEVVWQVFFHRREQYPRCELFKGATPADVLKQINRKYATAPGFDPVLLGC